MTDPKTRTYVLAQTAEALRALGPAGLDSNDTEWRLGSLGFWKSSVLALDPCPVPAFAPGNPLPRYRRGGLVFSLFPDMELAPEPFKLNDGRDAVAILLRSDKDPEGIFGTFTLEESEARRIIAFVTSEMNVAREIAAARFQATGGDVAVIDSLRAPSRAELAAQLDAMFGDPDEE
jgi:hypothetical protein